MKYILLYLGTFTVFIVIDLIWLGLIARNLYQQQLGYLMAENVKWVAAIIFYLIFVVGVIVFAVIPGGTEKNLIKTLLLGAFFGFVAYATYDLTNLATIKDWPLKIVLIDITWGTTLSTLTSLGGYYIYNLLF